MPTGVLDGWLGHLFNLGLAAVAGKAGFLSFDHIRNVAVEVGGQTPTGGAVVALVVDVLAVLAALVVIGAGTKIQHLKHEHGQAAAAQDEQAAEARRQEERDRHRAEAAERERLAAIEPQREADALERARLETDSAAAGPKQRRSAPAGTSPPKNRNGGSPSLRNTKLTANDRIQRYLAERPEATRGQVAAACEVDPSTVKRSAAWKSHRAARAERETAAA